MSLPVGFFDVVKPFLRDMYLKKPMPVSAASTRGTQLILPLELIELNVATELNVLYPLNTLLVFNETN